VGKQLARRPITSLPPRLAALAGAVGTVRHPGQPVRYNMPEGMAMSGMERQEAASLLSTLSSALDPTASFGGEDGHSAKGALLAKMIHGLGGAANQSETAATAKIEMYADAIEDLPAWAVAEAIKRWARGSCPPEICESPRFEFPPAPAVLRRLAQSDLDLPRRYVEMLRNLLAALPIDEAMNPEPRPAEPGLPTLRRM
jgi:hypothetical protein